MQSPRIRRTLIASLLMVAFAMTFGACQTVPDRSANAEIPSLTTLYFQLAERRAENLDRLVEYRADGVYPRNHVVPGMANVFIDEDDHLCAVANLMWHDGETNLVAQTAANDNLVVLADVDDGPLYDWMLSSGFTQSEIARIQEPYAFDDPNLFDPNFDPNEDQRLNDHFVQLEQELRQDSAASILAAARSQRETIVAQYNAR